jgi:PAS domain S-box-containing protein
MHLTLRNPLQTAFTQLHVHNDMKLDSYTSMETTPSSLPPAFSVLVIDDNEEDCYALRRLLRQSLPELALDIRVAYTGARGLALCRERLPDCILLDYSLGDTDGLSLLAELNTGRDPDDDPICPAVILTGARPPTEVAVRALKGGAQDYLIKETLTPEGVCLAIENAVEKVRLRRELRASEERYRLLVEGAKDYAMILMDVAGNVTSWNLGAERILGWSQAEVLGRPADLIFLPEDSAADVLAREMSRATTEGQATFLRWLLRKDGSRFYADGTMASVWADNGRLRGFAKVLKDATARQALEVEREALLIETRARAEREELINQIGQALLATPDPAVFQAQAVTLLGAALGADRCYLSSWDAARDQITVLEDYRRTDLPSMAGEYIASEYAPVMAALLAQETIVIPDVRSSSLPEAVAAVLAGFALRSVLAVPLLGGGGQIIAMLCAAMADGRREWTAEEVSLVQMVAALTRTAVEAARVAERERTIATHLQAALTPPIPASVPGLALTKYYEATLAEALVGGDFYDVFTLKSDCTVLVVGDLSGKGLEAAAQVATVRNMLRYALYRSRKIVGALHSLNSLLIEQHLLTGFATLFVAVYDSETGILAYVNCGQEPALVRRAAGAVEPLSATGPVLGVSENATFKERTVTLGAGDTLVVLTDGLTDCGMSRQEMLGIDGVAALLAPSYTLEEAQSAESLGQAVALRLIEGVGMASPDGLPQDDICILVAVAKGAIPSKDSPPEGSD